MERPALRALTVQMVLTALTVQMALIDLLEHRPIFCAGYDCIFHAHTAQSEVTIESVCAEP